MKRIGWRWKEWFACDINQFIKVRDWNETSYLELHIKTLPTEVSSNMWRSSRDELKEQIRKILRPTNNTYSWLNNRTSTRQRLNNKIRKTSASQRVSCSGFQQTKWVYFGVKIIHAVSSSEHVRSSITYLNLLGTSSWSISSLLDWRTAHDNAEKWIKEWNSFQAKGEGFEISIVSN